MTVIAKRITQTCFYFTHEQVCQALEEFIKDDANMPRDHIKPRISAGVSVGGVTLTYQASKELTPSDHPEA